MQPIPFKAKPTALATALGLSLCLSVQTHAAAFTVDSTDDNELTSGCSDEASGLTLREAICQAQSNPDADTITFDPALSGGTITLSQGQ